MIEDFNERLVDQNSGSWNRIAYWVGQIKHLQEAAGAGMLAR